MRIRWYGQSAFLLEDGERRVFIDPFGDMSGLEALVTVVGIASEHDDVAATLRGANTIFRFELGGERIAHLGDFGQTGLRHEQRAAVGDIDILSVPVGGFATIGGVRAAEVVQELAPRLVVPMHYRTAAVSFLDPPDEFLNAIGATVTETESEFDGTLAGVVLPAVPA